MNKFSLALALVGLLMLALGSASTLAAPSGNGATTINIDTCVPLIGGGTVCIESKGMLKETATPSGNTSYVTNYREHMWVIDATGEIIWDETSSERFHSLSKDDALHEMSSRSRFTITSFGQTFCVQYHLHGAQGEDVFVRIDFCD